MNVPQQIVNGLILGSVYALFALSFTLIFGTLRILNLAQGAILAAGAFAGVWLSQSLGLPFILAVPVAMGISAAVSVAVDLVAFRPLRRQALASGSTGPGFSTIVTSLGAGTVVTALLQILSETRILPFPTEPWLARSWQLGSLHINGLQVLTVSLCLALAATLIVLLDRSTWGIRIRAVAADEVGAASLGVNTARAYATVFFLSGALAGVCGVLVGMLYNSVQFLMGGPYLVTGAVIITVGGLGSIRGAMIVGLALGVLQTLTVATINSNLSDAVIFAILFAFLMFRPAGLFGSFGAPVRVGRQ